jgi:hypothetical protein
LLPVGTSLFLWLNKALEPFLGEVKNKENRLLSLVTSVCCALMYFYCTHNLTACQEKTFAQNQTFFAKQKNEAA